MNINTDKVTRVEVISNVGRAYLNWNPKNKVSVSMQDDNRTMKIFINRREEADGITDSEGKST